MANNETVTEFAANVADNGEITIEGSDAETGEVSVMDLGASGDCEVYRDFDPDGDGSWAASDQLAGPTDDVNPTTGDWNSTGNDLRASVEGDTETRIRMVNVSGGTLDRMWMVGRETGRD